MRIITTLILATCLLPLVGCARRADYEDAQIAQSSGATNTSAPATKTDTGFNQLPKEQAVLQKVSLAQADQSQAATAAIERKIVRNAELTVEVPAPAEAERKVAAIADARGGFVVTSEAQQSNNAARPAEVVNIVVRVPAAQFDAAVDEIRGLGSRVPLKKITTQDVTEEYIDLEARLRTQRALEAQYLEIMKQAQKVSDALEVNRQLAEVRGVIEQTEGRRRFLENQAALSTIKVTLETPAPLVSANTNGFFAGIKEALGDGVDIAVAIILVAIRVVIALIPVLLLIVLPLALLWRFWRRRHPRPAVAAPQPEER